jgi:hypothetical protein
MKPLAPPTAEEREKARAAVAALRLAIADPATMGARSSIHVSLSRPRRGEWWTMWENLPGFARVGRTKASARYSHTLLPGWEYARHEVVAEMIPDLEALAERGERPTQATSPAR